MSFSYNRFAALLDLSLDKILAQRKHVVTGLVGAAVLVVAGVGFNWYWNGLQESAQKDFIEMTRYFEAPVINGVETRTEGESLQFGSEQEKWAFIAQAYDKAYSKNKRAGIGPMFKLYQVDALLQLNKRDEAIEALEGAVKATGNREVQDFLKLKLALIKMDSAHQEQQKLGLGALKGIAEDTSSYAHEAALYYVGYYFFAKNDTVQAKNYWQQLMVKYGMQDSKQQSPYAELVRAKLHLISSDW